MDNLLSIVTFIPALAAAIMALFLRGEDGEPLVLDRKTGQPASWKAEGVQPEHVVDILALMGDNVDNVPGVPGIGPKTAAKLILEYGSIDGLYEHLDEIKGKRRENLEAARDSVPLSRSLVELKRDMDVDFDLDAASVDTALLPVGPLHETFRELNFRSHVETLDDIVGREQPAPETVSGQGCI